jgi:hypothetical protein
MQGALPVKGQSLKEVRGNDFWTPLGCFEEAGSPVGVAGADRDIGKGWYTARRGAPACNAHAGCIWKVKLYGRVNYTIIPSGLNFGNRAMCAHPGLCFSSNDHRCDVHISNHEFEALPPPPPRHQQYLERG